MNNHPSNVDISVNELKLLVNTLSKSVALSLKKRFAWLWLLAGLLIGVGVTLLIISLAWEKTDKISVTSETLLEKTNVVMSDLQKINSDITKLTKTVNVLNEKTKTGNTPAPSSKIKPTGLNEPQHIIQPKQYTVYLHYSDTKNTKLMEIFSAFLEENGFEVSGIQKVNYKNQDIRFFHDQDRKGAFLLKKHLTGFIQSVKNLKEKKVKVINLSRKYPGAQKGLLEVWVDF
ncbi:MAG: hypothetical protein JRE28_08515 [Deltaproteobacteria bacterium]|nr:hypothetical protein [Deltaproteobacteria bacterium]